MLLRFIQGRRSELKFRNCHVYFEVMWITAMPSRTDYFMMDWATWRATFILCSLPFLT